MLLRIKEKTPKRKTRKLTQIEREAEQAYAAMQSRLDALPKFAHTERPKDMTLRQMPKLDTPPGRSNTKHIKSFNATEHGDYAQGYGYKQSPKYTGSKMLGVSTLHKSNGVPVFSDEEIKDISKMRR